MGESVQVVFGLLGGLAFFLTGMSKMSGGLQRIAGERMRTVLGLLTKNALFGVIAGALVTAVLQSSSATTVMAIGFVASGLLSLPQAISIIFGANIGTTITAQMIAFKLSDYILAIIFIGFLMNFTAKRENVKNYGEVIFSFGLLFEGIEIMSSAMKPLASSSVFGELIGQVASFPVLGVFLGMCMTLLAQSSSATIAVLQTVASQPASDGVSSIIGLTGAIPILLGDNIGTTVTALIACILLSRDAKRVAVAHTVFNVSGAVLFLFLIPYLAEFVQLISPSGNEVDVISRQIANAHTTFNLVMTLIWLPLLPVMVKIVTVLIPENKDRYLADHTDALALGCSTPTNMDHGVTTERATSVGYGIAMNTPVDYSLNVIEEADEETKREKETSTAVFLAASEIDLMTTSLRKPEKTMLGAVSFESEKPTITIPPRESAE